MIHGICEVENIDDPLQQAKWLNARYSGIGSSDIPVIAGLNPYRSELDLWIEKTGKAPPFEDNDAMRLGRLLEPFIGEMFGRQESVEVRPAKSLYRHPSYDFALASPDFFFTKAGLLNILETKNTSSFMWHEWEEGPPLRAELQLQWQMGVIGIERGSIAGLVGANTFNLKKAPFEFSTDVFEQTLELADAFWKLVKADIPPKAGPGDSKAIERLIGERSNSLIELDAAAIPLVEQFQTLCKARKSLDEQSKILKERETGIKNQLLMMIGAHKFATIPDSPLLLEANPVTVDPYQNSGYSYVRFTVKDPTVKKSRSKK